MIGEKEDERCMNFALCWIWAFVYLSMGLGWQEGGSGYGSSVCVIREK